MQRKEELITIVGKLPMDVPLRKGAFHMIYIIIKIK
ncbi:hypothetical protein HNR39_001268 [Glaciimonas immobilis]|uniref:Uncharacterized protein n=1 Tax=Glaciimonas immobilis TaxID=728004 RepID=A0A840RS60_9BURK|nr:hypothetical protein [Glaciimonas immobilis]